jgi:hypothetical protein
MQWPKFGKPSGVLPAHLKIGVGGYWNSYEELEARESLFGDSILKNCQFNHLYRDVRHKISVY